MTTHSGIDNKEYNLISVLYHALSGADSCLTYIQDAERGNDPELVDFFKDTMEHYHTLINKAKSLSSARLSQ